MGKAIQKLVQRAANDTTNGCTLTLFQRAAAHSIAQQRRRRKGQVRTGAYLLTAEQLHVKFQESGAIPRLVENFVRGGHHFTATA